MSSAQRFAWWWDETFGETPVATPPYQAEFAIGNGIERHSLRAITTNGIHTDTLDLDTSIDDACRFGLTWLTSANATPGP